MTLASRLLAAIPNTLSVARMALGLAFPWVPANGRVAVVIAAALSDLLDGDVRRWLHAVSPVGRTLEPVADKVFVLAVVGTLMYEGWLEVWEVILVGVRDLAVLAGAGWALVGRDWSAFGRMAPTGLGKATT